MVQSIQEMDQATAFIKLESDMVCLNKYHLFVEITLLYFNFLHKLHDMPC